MGQYQGGEEQCRRCPGQEPMGALHWPHHPLAAPYHCSAQHCPAAQWHQCSTYTKSESACGPQLAAFSILHCARNSWENCWGFVFPFSNHFLQIYFYTNYLFQQAGIPSDKIPYVTIGTGACECITALTCVSIWGFFFSFCMSNNAKRTLNELLQHHNKHCYHAGRKERNGGEKKAVSGCPRRAMWKSKGKIDFKECLFPLARLYGLVTSCVCLTGFPHRKSGKESSHRWRLHADEHLLHFIHTHTDFSGKHKLKLNKQKKKMKLQKILAQQILCL